MFNYYIYGINSVRSALLNKERVIFNVLVANKDSLTRELSDLIANRKLKIQYISKQDLSKRVNSDFHQGIAIETKSIAIAFNNNAIQNMNKIVILDQISDSNNFGAIVRSAAFFGINCIILPMNNSVKENSIVAKVASGGLESIKIMYVTNIVTTIEVLKKNRFWIIGLDEDGEKFDKNFIQDEKIALIFGSEGNGMRALVAKQCDKIFAIENLNRNKQIVSSLNVSVAAGVIFTLISY